MVFGGGVFSAIVAISQTRENDAERFLGFGLGARFRRFRGENAA